MKVSEERELLRPRDAVRRLALSVPQIYHLASSGVLPCVKLGRSVRFRPADVDRFIRENRRGGKDAA